MNNPQQDYIKRLEDKSRDMFLALGLIEHALEHGDIEEAKKLAAEGKEAFFAKRIVSTNPSTLLSLGKIN